MSLNFGNLGTLNSEKNVNKNVNINGYTDDVGIANEFAKHFSSDTTALARIVKVFRIFYIIERSGYLTVLCPITNV